MNPAANTTLPRIPRVDIHPPSPAQVVGLIRLAAEDEPELGTFLRMAAATGVRRGEICGLVEKRPRPTAAWRRRERSPS